MPPKRHQGNTTDSRGIARAKATFSQADIDIDQSHFPPVLTPTNPKENSLVSIANNWGVNVSVEGDKGAKKPVTSRSIMNIFSALSVYQQQPEDNFWTDILERGRKKNGMYGFLNSIISKQKYSDITTKLGCTIDQIYSYVRICALTGLPFIPGIDSQDLDHCESANRTSQYGLPITSRNCSAGHVWESTTLVASTLSSANRSAKDSSYFSPFQKLSLGPLSMLINEKATLKISKDLNSCCLKHPFHEFRTMVPGDIENMIKVVYNSLDTSQFLKEVIDNINIKEHIKFHISNLKLWPTLKDILRIMNRELYKDMKSLFTESRIDLQEGSKIKDSMSDITILPTLYDVEVEDKIDFSDTELLNHAKLYILKPFGFIHALAFLGDRYEKLEGTQFQRVLETIYGIGEMRNIGMGDHAISAYATAYRASEPKFKALQPPPPPPLPKLDLTNVEQLDVIQRNIANWLGTHPIEHGEFYNGESGAINRIADEFLKDFNLSEIYNISGARNLTIKNMIKDLLLIVHHAGNYNGDMRYLAYAVATAIQHIDDMLVESEDNIMDEGSSPPNAEVLADSQFPVGRLPVFEISERRARANAMVDISPTVKRRTKIFNKPQEEPPLYKKGPKLIDSDPMRDNKRKRSPSISPNSSKNREKESKSMSPSKKGGKRKTRKNRR